MGQADAADVSTAYDELATKIEAAGCTSRLVVADVADYEDYYRDLEAFVVSRDAVDPAEDFRALLEVEDFTLEELVETYSSPSSGRTVDVSGAIVSTTLALTLPESQQTIWQQEIRAIPEFPESFLDIQGPGVHWALGFARQLSQVGIPKLLRLLCGQDAVATTDFKSYAAARYKTIASLDRICSRLIPRNEEWHSVDDLGPNSVFVVGNRRAQESVARAVGKLKRLTPDAEFKGPVKTLIAILDEWQRDLDAMLASASRYWEKRRARRLGNEREFDQIFALQLKLLRLELRAQTTADAIGTTRCRPSLRI